MRVGGWLERFRRPAGVPEAATDDLGPELLPVFAALDEIEEAAHALRAETERAVARRLDEAAHEAERVLARWQKRAARERARAETRRRKALAAEAHAIEAAAEAEADRVLREGRERIPPLVAAVLACITEEEA